MSPTQGGLVYTGKESQPSLLVLGNLVVEESSLFPDFKELNCILGLFYVFMHLKNVSKVMTRAAVYGCAGLHCSRGVCPRQQAQASI